MPKLLKHLMLHRESCRCYWRAILKSMVMRWNALSQAPLSTRQGLLQSLQRDPDGLWITPYGPRCICTLEYNLAGFSLGFRDSHRENHLLSIALVVELLRAAELKLDRKAGTIHLRGHTLNGPATNKRMGIWGESYRSLEDLHESYELAHYQHAGLAAV